MNDKIIVQIPDSTDNLSEIKRGNIFSETILLSYLFKKATINGQLQ